MPNPTLQLSGFTFAELFNSDGLNRLDQAFLTQLKEKNSIIHEKLLVYRQSAPTFTDSETSELLIDCAKILEEFLARLFKIDEAVALSQIQTTSHNPIAIFKKYFVLRRAKKELAKVDTFPSLSELNSWFTTDLATAPLKSPD